MNKYYKKLELDKILELLAEQTVSDGCRESALKLKPVTDFAAITEELKKTDDAFTLSAKFGTPAFRKVKDISGSLKRAETGSMLSFRAFRRVFSPRRRCPTLPARSLLRYASESPVRA